MSKMKHTPEPWGNDLTPMIEQGSTQVKINGAPLASDARILAEPNFQRAVKCVNACAGMEDPAAEIRRMRERIAELEGGTEAVKPELSDRAKQLPESFFVPCTKQESYEVYALLEENGYLPYNPKLSKNWTNSCSGVKVYKIGEFMNFHQNFQDVKEITLPELRKILSK